MTRSDRTKRATTRLDRIADPNASNAGGGGTLPGTGQCAENATAQVRIAPTEALLRLCQRDDGWLRIIPPRDNYQLYLKWKFNRGPWANHYLMVVVPLNQLSFGLQLLNEKCHDVDDGQRTPSVDRYFDPQEGL